MNEIDRVVVVVPEKGETLGGLGSKFVAVAIEDRGGQRHAESVTRFPEYAYSVIGRACDSRATETIGGNLLVRGKTVTPEAYLRNWRAAIAGAVTPEVAEQTHGVVVKLIVRGNVNAQKGKPVSRTYDTKAGFDEWAAELVERIKPDEEGYFEFELDIREPDAYLTWELVCGYRDFHDNDQRNKPGMRIELRSRGADVDVQPVGAAAQRDTPEQACLFA